MNDCRECWKKNLRIGELEAGEETALEALESAQKLIEWLQKSFWDRCYEGKGGVPPTVNEVDKRCEEWISKYGVVPEGNGTE